MSHVFVRLSGHGVRLLPYWPYRFARTGRDAAAVKVACWAAPGVKEVLVTGSSVPDVVDVEEGPDGDWWIETSVFDCMWPLGFTVESPTDPGDAATFYLFGPGQEMIFVPGPVKGVPEPSALTARGQALAAVRDLDAGIRVVELTYKHSGTPWRQSHWLVPWSEDRTLVVTAQAPAAEADGVAAAAMQVAMSVRKH